MAQDGSGLTAGGAGPSEARAVSFLREPDLLRCVSSGDAVLLYRGCQPPLLREAWSHEDTPKLIVDQWGPVLPSMKRRQDLEHRLKTLYKLRVSADYIGEDNVEAAAITGALRDAGFLIKVAGDILPEG